MILFDTSAVIDAIDKELFRQMNWNGARLRTASGSNPNFCAKGVKPLHCEFPLTVDARVARWTGRIFSRRWPRRVRRPWGIIWRRRSTGPDGCGWTACWGSTDSPRTPRPPGRNSSGAGNCGGWKRATKRASRHCSRHHGCPQCRAESEIWRGPWATHTDGTTRGR